MTDYLIDQYNAKMNAIQDREAKDLAGALEIYTHATKVIVERHAMERIEAATEMAAAMSQRDHEYHNGRPKVDFDQQAEPVKVASGLAAHGARLIRDAEELEPKLPTVTRLPFIHEVSSARAEASGDREAS